MWRNSFVVLIFVVLTTVFAEKFKDVEYSVIEKTSLSGVKLSIDIRLSKKVDNDFLKEFALFLKNSDKGKYKNIFMCYYLPDMKVGSGAWATTHFNPDLKVEILGMTLEQEKKLKSEKAEPDQKIIGKWKDESPFVGAIWKMFEKNKKTFLLVNYNDGSKSENELILKKEKGITKYYEKDDRAGTYFIITKSGDLSIYDNEGFFMTLKKIK